MQKKMVRMKHSYEDRLRYMHMIEDGFSITSISDKYGINKVLLSTLWHKFKKYGTDSIRKGKNFIVSPSLKKEIILDIEYNHVTLWEASLKYGPSSSIIQSWLRIYHKNGLEALDIVKRRGRPACMGRPKMNSKPSKN